MKKKSIQYTPGMFHMCMVMDGLDFWDTFHFPEMMWGLGYEMDSCNRFEEYRKKSKLPLKPAHSEREKKRNILYLLEHADRQIVGNYLFSMWRYYTHWSYYYDYYDVDFLRRIVRILEDKYAQEGDIGQP